MYFQPNLAPQPSEIGNYVILIVIDERMTVIVVLIESVILRLSVQKGLGLL